MTRVWLLRVTLALCSALASPSLAQVDYDAIRSGTAGCPELAVDPAVGDLAAFLCQPADRTSLDLPINPGGRYEEVRAGAFSTAQRASLLGVSRGDIGEAEFARLQGLLLDGAVPSLSQSARARLLDAEAAFFDEIGDAMQAAELRAQAAAIRAGTFDESIPALLASRIDRDRLADFRSGLLQSVVARDTVSSYGDGVASNLTGVAYIGGLPPSVDEDGMLIVNQETVLRNAYPFFVGPDGRGNTADDLPFVRTNPAAQAAGYALASPIAGTTEDRFDRLAFVGAMIQVYDETAQITVESASPGTPKLVELYGVFNDVYLAGSACSFLGGVFNVAGATCTGAGGIDLSAAAFEQGCAVEARSVAGFAFGVGLNADGDCIEVNSSANNPALVQFEVLALLADPVVRPAGAALEPADLTDLGRRSRGAPGLFARPPSPSGNVSFPGAQGAFSRKADLVSGAPASPDGTQCRVRADAQAIAIGPNGIAGDGDDFLPSAGDCLLWGAPDAGGVQPLRSPAAIASSHSANQSLFHTLCTLTFDQDTGHCVLDELNNPDTLSFTSLTLGGLGSLSGTALTGLDSVRTSRTSVDQRSRVVSFLNAHFLAINPLATQIPDNQDFGLVATHEQMSLLGCGAAFASPCTAGQSTLWANTPAIAASLGGRVSGGIDLLNAAASVVLQEFTTVKALQSGALVGTATDASSQLVYLPGMNFSRNGTLVNVPGSVPGFQMSVEQGAYLGLTPAQALAWSPSERGAFQHGPPNKVQADGWVEPMPWAYNEVILDRFGAIVFDADPNDPFDDSSPLNNFNPDGGEYCARWMDEVASATPFNQTCTVLETISANLERLIVAREIIGQDRMFDPPESLDELVAMLDGDPSNDAVGDPIAGPDGIFARNQFVLNDGQMDFEVVRAFGQLQLSTLQLVPAPADKQAAIQFLFGYDPNVSCTTLGCYLQVNEVLTDPDDAQSPDPLVLAMPIGATVDVMSVNEPNDPSEPPVISDSGLDTKVNLALLQYSDLSTLRRLFAGQLVSLNGEYLQMNAEQREALLGRRGTSFPSGRDLDNDGVTDLDRDRDGVWDGLDDFSPGPVSDDEVLCGSGIPGDVLQDGIQFAPHRHDEDLGTSNFIAHFPDGFSPRSPVFCRALNALLALAGPDASGSDEVLWHGGSGGDGTDSDSDGWPNALDSCPTLPDPAQSDVDADGVGDVCDNCVSVANPRVASGYVTSNPWATLTGGQRDDDHDGFGNRCDAKFVGSMSHAVAALDLAQFRASNGHDRRLDVCGTTGDRPCAIFDLDDEPSADAICMLDLNRFRALSGHRPGPKCPTCPLECEAGAQGSCN